MQVHRRMEEEGERDREGEVEGGHEDSERNDDREGKGGCASGYCVQ